MNQRTQQDPMHGKTLKMILEELVSYYGWGELGIYVKIRCFNMNPSIKSSLAFLRKTPWARTKVEALYKEMLDEKNGKPKANNSPWPDVE
ncbi:VF530 family protein [Ghiorsea bivora]|uniref:VF530 family protein n=1 Tax=Ghiorsea bivora TaxID=1485545 RepID=UPI00056F573F|nr:VF530 family protein [Ghiorsea bivora]